MNDYINAHPKECLRLVLILFCLLWQSVAGVFGIVLYVVWVRLLKCPGWLVLVIGILIAASMFYFQYNTSFLQQGFALNKVFWKYLISNDISGAFLFLYHYQLEYIFGFSPLIAGVFTLIDLMPVPAHQHVMQALQKGEPDLLLSKTDKEIAKALKTVRDEHYNGTVLGVSTLTAQPIVIPDQDVNQVMLVLGTTGAGKTITLRRFYQRAITQGYPLIIVDGKPDSANIAWLQSLAKQYNRLFIGFNCGNNLSYDPLANGGYTELKDKIISLKDEWSSDYYRSIAEDYLQTTLAVLLKLETPFDLKKVVECLNYDELAVLARQTKDNGLIKKVISLEHYDRKDITGLQAHLNILIHSELGQFFETNDTTFNLSQAIQQNAVVYFALPALRFPSFSKVLGKLVINDLKAVVDRDLTKQRIFTVFDEFSVFAGEQVLNLVNMGRGKGVHAIFGTQGLADLEKIDNTFKNQVLNCANTLICHRLNDQESAETIASWIGTKDIFTVTAQISSKEIDAGMGTVKRNKEFIIHPDSIKQELKTGEAFYVSKVRNFSWNKVKIKYL